MSEIHYSANLPLKMKCEFSFLYALTYFGCRQQKDLPFACLYKTAVLVVRSVCVAAQGSLVKQSTHPTNATRILDIFLHFAANSRTKYCIVFLKYCTYSRLQFVVMCHFHLCFNNSYLCKRCKSHF